MTTPESNIENAPAYIKAYVKPITAGGPSDILLDGYWCGHGEDTFRLYDVQTDGEDIFEVILPDIETEESNPPVVKLKSVNSDASFIIYNSKEHPASMFTMDSFKHLKTQYADALRCPVCDKTNFKVAIGLEVPGDTSSNEDTSWFSLATLCVSCNDLRISFDDETA